MPFGLADMYSIQTQPTRSSVSTGGGGSYSKHVPTSHSPCILAWAFQVLEKGVERCRRKFTIAVLNKGNKVLLQLLHNGVPRSLEVGPGVAAWAHRQHGIAPQDIIDAAMHIFT
jgi:hypothetical protein